MEKKLVDAFIGSVRDKGLAESSIPNFIYGMKCFVRWCREQGHKSFYDLQKDDLSQYFASLKDFADATIYDKLHVVYCFFEYLHSKGFLLLNPCPKPTCSRIQKLPRAVPRQSDIAATYSILASVEDIEDQRNFMIIDLIHSCGIRRCEVHSLNIGDVYFDEQIIKVRGKNRKERIVPVHPYTLQDLQYYITKIRPLFLKKKNVKALFVTKWYGGKRIAPHSISEALHRMRKKYKLPDSIAPHSLRHFFATSLIRNDCSITDVAMLLGHSSLDTSQIYCRLLPADLKNHHKNIHPRG